MLKHSICECWDIHECSVDTWKSSTYLKSCVLSPKNELGINFIALLHLVPAFVTKRTQSLAHLWEGKIEEQCKSAS